MGEKGKRSIAKEHKRRRGKHRSSKVERRDKTAAEIAGFRRMGRGA